MNNGKHIKKSKKRRVLTVLLSILAVLVICAAAVGIWQRDNIKALYISLTTDAETLVQQQQESTQRRDDILLQYGLVVPSVDPVTGTVDVGEPSSPEPGSTPEAIPGGETAPETTPGLSAPGGEPDSPTPTPTPTPTPSPKPGDKTDEEEHAAAVQAEIQGLVNQLYQLEANFKAQLNAIIQEADNEFHSLPKEQWTAANRLSVIMSKLGVLTAAEASCDAQFQATLSTLESVLKREGMDMALATEIRSYYETSKANTIASLTAEAYKYS